MLWARGLFSLLLSGGRQEIPFITLSIPLKAQSGTAELKFQPLINP